MQHPHYVKVLGMSRADSWMTQQLSRPRNACMTFKELSAVPAWHLGDKAQTWQTLCIELHIQAVKAEASFGSATPAAMAKWLCPKLICQISRQQDTQRGRVSQQAQQRECNG